MSKQLLRETISYFTRKRNMFKTIIGVRIKLEVTESGVLYRGVYRESSPTRAKYYILIYDLNDKGYSAYLSENGAMLVDGVMRGTLTEALLVCDQTITERLAQLEAQAS